MSFLRSWGSWMREHLTATACIVVSLVAVLTAVVVISSGRTSARVSLRPTSEGHHAGSDSPNVLTPPPGVEGVPADSQERFEPLTPVPSTGKPAGSPSSPDGSGVSSKVKDSKTTVVQSPDLAGTSGLGFDNELKNPAPAVTTQLPATLALPAGTTAAAPTSRYDNGVVEWLFANNAMSYEAMAEHVRGKVTTNGWQIVGEPPLFTYPDPDGSTISSKRFYVKQGSAVRGYVIVSSRGNKPGCSVQIDLLGV